MSLIVLLLFPLSGLKSEAAVTFRDVATDFRAYKEIAYLTEGKIVQGDGSNFYPYREVTRAEAIAMLGRAIDLNGTKRVTDFSDVPMNTFASGYIQSAVEKHIITESGTFHPNQPIKRGEMALFISRAFRYEGQATEIEAANELKTRGIASGISSTDFGYSLNIKRADFAVFLARAINYQLRSITDITFSGERYVKASDHLNVRTGPSTSFQKVGELLPGTKVETAYDVGSWTYIKAEHVEGLVHRDYLVESSTTTPPIDQSLSSQVVMIDPGHGGTDPGAIGFGLLEKNVVLDTALEVQTLLKNTPIQIKLTRETDVFPSLRDRVSMAKAAKANAFISIHANASNGKASGTETFYYRSAAVNPNWEDSSLLASFIQERMVQAWNLPDRGIKNGDLHVLRENTMPAVLVELGFIDRATDNEYLKSPEWRKKAAEAIYFGILDYYQSKGYDVEEYYDYQNLASEE
ncbi:N-acetylmuramoyl-L-alanine amidase [Bacillus sp. CGMCC 1.16607]|uniref:N-acetylmuramoyl-L-alanine amidase n=1 Tax=Bacillus sp. CGMCC 1.16607 TaxID=3351842 RepID=UPI00363B6EAA